MGSSGLPDSLAIGGGGAGPDGEVIVWTKIHPAFFVLNEQGIKRVAFPSGSSNPELVPTSGGPGRTVFDASSGRFMGIEKPRGVQHKTLPGTRLEAGISSGLSRKRSSVWSHRRRIVAPGHTTKLKNLMIDLYTQRADGKKLDES